MRKKKRRKLWSIPRIQHPKFPGLLVRITEVSPGGSLYAVRMLNGKQKMTSLRRTRADLGKDDKTQEWEARAFALDLIEELAEGKDADAKEVEKVEVLTLNTLADKYEARGLFGTTDRYKKEQVATVRRVTAFFGEAMEVSKLHNASAR